MKIEVVCRDHKINSILNISPITYNEALKKAFSKIENNEIVSSWKDAYASSGLKSHISDYIQVPTFGCFTDIRQKPFEDRSKCIEKIWGIGGENGRSEERRVGKECRSRWV